MPTTEPEIDGFAAYAKTRLANETRPLSLDEIYDDWRTENPPADAAAIAASLRDMHAGETGRPFDEFAAAFRSRYGTDC